MELLPISELPDSFNYPKGFLKIVDQSLINLDPWVIYSGEDLKIRYEGLKKRFPDRNLIPFARRWDNDDVACWDEAISNKVFIIHDFASPGFEQRAMYDNFWDWFRVAINDMIEHEP